MGWWLPANCQPWMTQILFLKLRLRPTAVGDWVVVVVTGPVSFLIGPPLSVGDGPVQCWWCGVRGQSFPPLHYGRCWAAERLERLRCRGGQLCPAPPPPLPLLLLLLTVIV